MFPELQILKTSYLYGYIFNMPIDMYYCGAKVVVEGRVRKRKRKGEACLN